MTMGTEELVEFDPEKIKGLKQWDLEEELMKMELEGVLVFEADMKSDLEGFTPEAIAEMEAIIARVKATKEAK
jgi:hypothetical protein